MCDDGPIPGILDCQGRENGLYPKVDLSIWLRSCVGDQNPVKGTTKGTIPTWIKGSLVQNGPGKFSFGSDTFKHLFDGSALLQKFQVENGEVNYSCSFIKTQAYTENVKHNSIVQPEFGTIVKNRRSIIPTRSSLMSDNTMITVYPFNDSLYTFYESPFIYKINPNTLETNEREDFGKLGLVSHASHVHFDQNKDMISLGMKLTKTGPHYVVNRFKYEQDSDTLAGQSKELLRIRPRWMFNPSYMHSFSITPRYVIIVEQPLTVNIRNMILAVIMNKPVVSALQWQDKGVIFHVIDKVSKKSYYKKFRSESFFYLHTINAFEKDDSVVIDICGYDSAAMLDCMFLKELQSAQSNHKYSNLFKGRPRRFVLPLNRENPKQKVDSNSCSKCRDRITPQIICDYGCETPAINYDLVNGRSYQYFYAITSDVASSNAGKLLKVNVDTGKVITWSEENTYCSEPVFIQTPGSCIEDDGVLVASMIRGKPDVRFVGLLILDAKTLLELGRAEFELAGPVPKPLHGCFLPSWEFNK